MFYVQCVTWVMTPELFSTQARTVGHASAIALSKIGALLAAFVVASQMSYVTVGVILGEWSCFFSSVFANGDASRRG